MPFFAIPVALYLLLYAPGHYLLRGQPNGQPRRPRLFCEVLLSACCTSWVGFVLAELSIYSLPALLACLAAVSAAAGVFTRGSQRWSYGCVDLVGLGIVLAAWLWVAPPFDTRILGSDSAGYLANGVYLSRHGSLVMHDPTLPLLSADLKRSLFPSVTQNPGAPPYLRLAGSLVLSSLDGDEVLPAFHHLIAVWIAVFHGIAGSQAAGWVITLFAGLSLWAMVQFAASVGGILVGLIFFLLLPLASTQYWYSRFLMPEVPAQLFIWGGLCAMSLWCRSQRRSDAVLAGIAFGIAGLMRLENAAFLFVALVAAFCLGERSPRPHRSLLFACAAAVWVHAAVHLVVFRTHYFGNLRLLVPETFPLFTQASPAQMALLIGGLAALVIWMRRTGGPAASRSLLLAAAFTAGVAFWGDWRHGWSSLRLLTSYIGIPTFVGGGIGLALYLKRLERGSSAERILVLLVAVAFAQVMVAPHATPVPLWTVRRAAPIVLPAFGLGVAFLCATLARRRHWMLAGLVFSFAVAGQALPFATLAQEPYYRGGRRQIQAIAALLPPGAGLIFDSQLIGWGFDTALWAERDLPAYFLPPSSVGQMSNLVRSLDRLPVYWMSDGVTPPPQIPGITVTPVALYEFTLLTPPVDTGASHPTNTTWGATVAVYSLQTSEQRPDGVMPLLDGPLSP